MSDEMQDKPASQETTTLEQQPNESLHAYLKRLSQTPRTPGSRNYVRLRNLGPITIFSTPSFGKPESTHSTSTAGTRRSEVSDEAEESNLLTRREIDARRHNERFQNSDSSPKTPSQVSDNAPEKPSFPETTTTERQQSQNQEQEEPSQRQDHKLLPTPEDLYQGWKVGGKSKLQEMLENMPPDSNEQDVFVVAPSTWATMTEKEQVKCLDSLLKSGKNFTLNGVPFVFDSNPGPISMSFGGSSEPPKNTS